MLRKMVVFSIMLLLAVPTFAGDRSEGGAIGVRGGINQYMGDDFDDSIMKPAFSMFAEKYFTNHFSLETAFNVSQMSGETKPVDFTSQLTGASLLGRMALLGSGFRPYLAGGVEILTFDPEMDPAASVNYDQTDNELAVGLPVGGGVSLGLTEDWVFDVRGLYHFMIKDDLDYLYGGSDDHFVTATAGLTKIFYANKDKDMDGLLKDDEKARGTDPNVADTDSDGLNDGEEVLTYLTDPLKVDSDDDGLSDMDELKKYKTDPLKADTDGDKLNDKEELMETKTNPLAADSDGDDLSDYAEIKRYETDPNKMDTDGDGLGDGVEVNKHKTSPLKKDTDDGTVDDAAEVKRGTNPLDKADDVILEVEKVGAKIILDGIVFKTGSADVSEESAEILEKAYQTMKAYPEMEVEIQGYTDSVGRESSNKRLSQRRADSVRQWLVNKGIEGARIVAKGYGEDDPIASNATKEGRAQNRRIEFMRLK
ncbi:MAG: OmpA family protein [candidate division KSB1 bacterium]|nr:OmpA family protein [candidate division KSB1 bacterium]